MRGFTRPPVRERHSHMRGAGSGAHDPGRPCRSGPLRTPVRSGMSTASWNQRECDAERAVPWIHGAVLADVTALDAARHNLRPRTKSSRAQSN
jgi:hypothetical protein